MNSALWSNLPRFDLDGQKTMSPPQLQMLLGKLPGDEFAVVPDEPLADEPPVEETPVKAEPTPESNELEVLLGTLPEALNQIAEDAQSQCVHLVRTISVQLFPVLAESFLAEEICQHLPALIPDFEPLIEVRAASGLAEQIAEIIGRNKALADRCRLMPCESPEQAAIDISWKTGGVNFNFEALLGACLYRLGQTQPSSEE